MKEGFCLVRFLDGQKLVKVAPLEYVRCAESKQPFEPKSSLDMPKGKVQVKWQRSVMADSFSDDGFFDAEILAISKGFESILAKAKDKGIRLPPCPMIQLPAKSLLEVKEAQSKRRIQKRSNSPNNVTTKSDGGAKRKREKDSCKTSDDSKKKLKPNKIAKDPVRNERISKVLVDAASNPLMSTIITKAASSHRASPKHSESHKATSPSSLNFSPTSLITKTKVVVSPDLFNLREVKDSKLSVAASPNPKAYIVSPLHSAVKRTLWRNDDFQVKSSDEGKMIVSTPKTSLCSTKEDEVLPLNASPVSSVDKTGKNDADTSGSDDDSLESTLPVEIEDIPCSTSSSSDMSDESEEDIAGQLIEIQKELKLLKEKLKETESQVTLSNNLRLKYMEKVSQLESDLAATQVERDALKAQVSKLRERNEWLQDALMSKGPSKDLDMGKNHRQSCNNPADTINETCRPIESAAIEIEPLEDKQESRPAKVPDVNVADDLNQSLEKPQEKKRKSKDKLVDLQNDHLVEACKTVLKHLSKEEELEANLKGQINIGNNVLVKKEAFEKNFSNNKLDLIAATRNLACLTWSKNERIERSFEGGKNNKCPDQPAKRMATPHKVLTVLGAVKAHMIHQGDVEGSRMVQTLQGCRKAIGTKFAQDAYNMSRAKKD